MHKKKLVTMALVSGLVLLSAGCAQHITSRPLQSLVEIEDYQGLAYQLTKSVIKLTAKYDVFASNVVRDANNNIIGMYNVKCILSAKEEPPIKIEALTFPDSSHLYLADLSEVSDSVVLQSDLTFKLNALGIITNADATITDNTLEAAKEASRLATKLASLSHGIPIPAAGAGPGAAAAPGGQPAPPEKWEFIETITVEYLLDPEKDMDADKTVLSSEDLFPRIEILNFDNTVSKPTLTVELTLEEQLSTEAHSNRLKNEKAINNSPKPLKGIVYRLPVSAAVSVYEKSTDELKIASAVLPFPQYSPQFIVPFSSKPLTKRTTKAVFSEPHYSISELTVNSESSADKVLKALNEMADEYAKQKSEAEKLEKQRKAEEVTRRRAALKNSLEIGRKYAAYKECMETPGNDCSDKFNEFLDSLTGGDEDDDSDE